MNMVCPNCNKLQENYEECFYCGIIISKFKPKSENLIIKKKQSNLNKIWHYLPIIYLFLVVADLYIISQNEFDRPQRERIYATVDLIEASLLLERLEAVKTDAYDLIDQRARISKLYEYLEYKCLSISPGVSFNITPLIFKATFPDGTILKYITSKSEIKILKRTLKQEILFDYIPNWFDLHLLYRDIDIDIEEIHNEYSSIDFSEIEKKYEKMIKFQSIRLIALGFILWAIPVLIYYIIWFELTIRRAKPKPTSNLKSSYL